MTQANRYAFNRMVQEHYVQRVRAIMAARRERIRGLRTRAQAEAYVRDIRGKVKRCFGAMPERTPSLRAAARAPSSSRVSVV